MATRSSHFASNDLDCIYWIRSSMGSDFGPKCHAATLSVENFMLCVSKYHSAYAQYKEVFLVSFFIARVPAQKRVGPHNYDV
jgi:hypothetical protein